MKICKDETWIGGLGEGRGEMGGGGWRDYGLVNLPPGCGHLPFSPGRAIYCKPSTVLTLLLV